MKVKVIGAGSIGNHLAQASRRMNWEVTVVDKDVEALRRMREEIYPARYGAWDENIRLFVSGQEPRGGFDIICIGTPPDVRMRLALEALAEEPRILQLEKPLCVPFDPLLARFLSALGNQPRTEVVVGYDHAVSVSINQVIDLLRQGVVGQVLTIDVEFREHWAGIFQAHPWLSGPQDTYLGSWQRGGGASGEHSHALHLWQYLARSAGIGEWQNVAVALALEGNAPSVYDYLASFTLQTTTGVIGRVIQDVITKPTNKHARIQGRDGVIEWLCGGSPKGDIVNWTLQNGTAESRLFPKRRPDDFYEEMRHIKSILDGKIAIEDSPLRLEDGLAVMAVLNTAWSNPAGLLKRIETSF